MRCGRTLAYAAANLDASLTQLRVHARRQDCMKKVPLRISLAFSAAYLMSSCGGGGSGSSPTSPPPAPTTTVAGVVQKGPFLSGSSISIQPLDGTMNPTGSVFEVTTKSDSGDFSAPNVPQNVPIELTATGFYYDEIRDTNSTSQITLRSVAQSGTGGSTHANTNVLTALAVERLKGLVVSGSAFSSAKSQAESEVLASLGISASTTGFETLDYSSNSGDNAKLLAASAIAQQLAVNESSSPSTIDSALSLFVSQFGSNLAANGTVNDTTLKNQVEDAINTVDVASVTANLSRRYQALGAVAAVPDFSSSIHPTVVVPRSFTTVQIAAAGLFPAIAVTADHVPHVFFVGVNPDSTGNLLHYWLAGATWMSEVLASNVGLVGASVAAVADPAGGLHVSWGNLYAFRPAGGGAWAQVSVNAATDVEGSSISDAGSGNTGISYIFAGSPTSSINTINYAAISNDGSLSTEYVADTGLQLQDSTIGQSTCLAYDSQSTPHIFWNDRGTLSPGLRHATKINGIWVVSTLVAGAVYSGCSAIVDTSGVLHVTYTDISTRSSPVIRQAALVGSTLTQLTQSPGSTETTSTIAISSTAPALVTNTAAGLIFLEQLHTVAITRSVSAQSSSYSDAKLDTATSKVHIAFSVNGGGGIWYGISN